MEFWGFVGEPIHQSEQSDSIPCIICSGISNILISCSAGKASPASAGSGFVPGELPARPLCLPSAHPSEKQQKAALEVIPDSCFHQKSPSLISGPAGEELSAVSFPLWPHRATPSFRSCFYPTKSCKPSHLSLGHSRCLSARTDVTPALLHHWQCVGCKIESIKTYRS